VTQSAVRNQIAAFIAAAKIPAVGVVYRGGPYRVDGAAFQLGQNDGHGAVLFVHIDSSNESRITFPTLAPTNVSGAVGQKRVDYVVSIVIFYKFKVQSLGQGQVVDVWVDPLDAIIDSLKTRIRSDPNQGDATIIFEAGQDPNDIRVVQDLPVEIPGGILFSLARLQYNVTEIITA
jgi:hypothetical protein